MRHWNSLVSTARNEPFVQRVCDFVAYASGLFLRNRDFGWFTRTVPCVFVAFCVNVGLGVARIAHVYQQHGGRQDLEERI